MGWQCVPQILGLVRGDGTRRDGNGKAKHRANAAAIINEAFEISDPEDGHAIPIRKSASETYDRERTKDNKYIGHQTADDVLEVLEAEAAKQKVDVRVKDKTTGETVIRQRGLPSNAVIGIATIFHPPCEIARGWTPEQYDKFIQDCEEVMEKIPCVKMDKKGKPIGEPVYLFRRENTVAQAEHWDEREPVDPPVYTGHWHRISIPKDQNGKYNGNLIDALFLSQMVNRMFAPMMRERGWDIDDPDCTDLDKFATDREYKAKRKRKIREGGKSVNNYRADKKLKEAEKLQEELEAIAEQATATVENADAMKQQAEADAADVRQEARADAGRIRTKARQDAFSIRKQAQAEAEAVKRQTEVDAAADAGDAVAQAMTEAEVDAAIMQDIAMLEAEIEAAATVAESQASAEAVKRQAEEEQRKAEDAAKDAKAERDAALQQKQVIQMGIPILQGVQLDLQGEIKTLTAKRDALKGEVAAERKAANDLRETKVAAAEKAAEEAARKKKDEITAEITKDAVADRDAARKEADDLRKTKIAAAERAAAKAAEAKRDEITATITRQAYADRDAARNEAAEIRKNMVEKGKQAGREAAKAEQARIEAAARDAWKNWLEDKKRRTTEAAEKIISDAKATAADIVAAARGEYAFLLNFFDNEPFVYKSGNRKGQSYLQVAREIRQSRIREQRLKAHPEGFREASQSQRQKDGRDATD